MLRSDRSIQDDDKIFFFFSRFLLYFVLTISACYKNIYGRISIKILQKRQSLTV